MTSSTVCFRRTGCVSVWPVALVIYHSTTGGVKLWLLLRVPVGSGAFPEIPHARCRRLPGGGSWGKRSCTLRGEFWSPGQGLVCGHSRAHFSPGSVQSQPRDWAWLSHQSIRVSGKLRWELCACALEGSGAAAAARGLCETAARCTGSTLWTAQRFQLRFFQSSASSVS